MADVVFALAYVGALVATLIISRSPATSAITVAVTVGISGVALQFVGTSGVSLTRTTLQWWLLLTLAAVVAVTIVLRRQGTRPATRTTWWIVLGSSAAVLVVAVGTRLLAPGNPGPLTVVGYLITRPGGEDNAKWLNAAAELASGAAADSWANVGGPLLLLLTLASTMIASVSSILYGGVNEVAVSGGTPVLTEMLLIALAPFALTPLLEARIRRGPDDRPRPLPWPMLLLGVVIITSGTAVLLIYGHVTLQYTLLNLTLWVSAFLCWRSRQAALVLTTLAVATTAEVWFPLSVVALVLLVGLAGLAVIRLVRRADPAASRRPAVATLAAALAVLVLMGEFLWSSIGYSLGVGGSTAAMGGSGALRGIAAVAVPSLPLFSENGGTEIVSTLMAAIAAVSVLGSLVVLRASGHRRYVLRFLPIIILMVFTLLVTLADFWAVGDGPGYASNKLTYAVTMPALAATLPVALLLLDRERTGMTAVRWFAVGAVVVLLVFDTLIPRALIQFQPRLWPTTNGDPQPYWWPAEVRPTADQPLASNPIACVYLPQGAPYPSALPDGQRAYSCTRLLVGVAGQESPAQVVVDWTLNEWLQNQSLWDRYSIYLSQLAPEVRNRTVILLNEDSEVVGIEKLQTLLDRFPPQPEAETTS